MHWLFSHVPLFGDRTTAQRHGADPSPAVTINAGNTAPAGPPGIGKAKQTGHRSPTALEMPDRQVFPLLPKKLCDESAMAVLGCRLATEQTCVIEVA